MIGNMIKGEYIPPGLPPPDFNRAVVGQHHRGRAGFDKLHGLAVAIGAHVRHHQYVANVYLSCRDVSPQDIGLHAEGAINIIWPPPRRRFAARRHPGQRMVVIDGRRQKVDPGIDDHREAAPGLSEEETAQALGTSLRTAQRDWMRLLIP